MRGGGTRRAHRRRLTIAAFVSGGKLTKARFAPVDLTDLAARQGLGQRVIARSLSHILGRIALRRGFDRRLVSVVFARRPDPSRVHTPCLPIPTSVPLLRLSVRLRCSSSVRSMPAFRSWMHFVDTRRECRVSAALLRIPGLDCVDAVTSAAFATLQILASREARRCSTRRLPF